MMNYILNQIFKLVFVGFLVANDDVCTFPDILCKICFLHPLFHLKHVLTTVCLSCPTQHPHKAEEM